MAKRRYGVGIQSFEKMRELGAAYVDKSALIYEMTQAGDCFFLSRPRRFGKSLLVSTMEAYFQGKKELFKGLEIEKLERNWISYPVLHFDFSTKDSRGVIGVQNTLDIELSDVLANHELDCFWFKSGTPSWLAKTLYQYDLAPVEMDRYSSRSPVFDTPSKRATSPIPVLYQSGYLTIKSYNKRRDVYTLGLPNE